VRVDTYGFEGFFERPSLLDEPSPAFPNHQTSLIDVRRCESWGKQLGIGRVFQVKEADLVVEDLIKVWATRSGR
jgi:hypothetical protein